MHPAVCHMTVATSLPSGLQPVWGYWRAGGPLMPALALVSFLIWYRYFRLRAQLRDALSAPPACLDDLEGRCRRIGPGPALLDWLAGLPGTTPRVARQALLHVAAGLPLREAFRQCRAVELSVYSHAFYFLGALVAAAPLLGLLGTVFGMIDTFTAVALRSGETADLVAQGISQALITTQVGLLAALPGTFGLAHLFRLYQRLRHELDRCESHLVVLVAYPGAGPTAGGGTA